ncbi:MAG TPA: sigma factor [Streptosporangiaceae bacterium]
MTDDALAAFRAHRPELFGIAYRMLGSVADAEDILQDAWLTWSSACRGGVRQPRPYLAKTVVNLALNKLTSAAVRRETYVGPWLPEPLVAIEPDAGREAELAEAVSLAMLFARQPAGFEARHVLVNGQPGLLLTSAGTLDNVVAADLDREDRICAIRLIRNPDKLRHLITPDRAASPSPAGAASSQPCCPR